MIIDSSAIMCLLNREPDRDRVLDCMSLTLPRRMSTATASELFAVVTRSRSPGWGVIETLIDSFRIEIVPYDSIQLAAFQHAYAHYGRGGHNSSQARLNLGDCFSYALAATVGEPLLYVGDDFRHTDIRSALDAYC